MIITEITETEAYYFLYISPKDRARASNIKPRDWNSKYQCWVYPRTVKSYDNLISEFGDELIEVKITRPFSINEASKNIEDDELKEELIKYKKLSLMLYEKNKKLQSDNNKIYKTINKIKGESIFNKIIKIPKNNSDAFKKIFKDQKVSLDLAVSIEINMKYILSVKLNVYVNNHSTFSLIKLAEEKNLITKTASDYAHTVRQVRNYLVHTKFDENKLTYMVLAFALLWEEIY